MSELKGEQEPAPSEQEKLGRHIETLVPGTNEAMAMNDATFYWMAVCESESIPIALTVVMGLENTDRIKERVMDRMATTPGYASAYRTAEEMLASACAESLEEHAPPEFPKRGRKRAEDRYYNELTMQFYRDVVGDLEETFINYDPGNDQG